jgi:glyoxylase-like metal-dependent hydrolase (beta-lactamase superfamily II)
MQIFSIDTGLFKLDGGAMFGVVPKVIWQKQIPADENNLCTWSMRCLLVIDEGRKILIDTGMGNKQSEKFFSHYYPSGEATLLGSLDKIAIGPEDITDVILTHLHFDHCGAAVKKEGEKLLPTFPNATYWSNESHWKWATDPNPREKASFLRENILPLEEAGCLQFIEEKKGKRTKFTDNIEILFSYGHTEAMMCPIVRYNEHTLVFVADLIPSSVHIPLSYVAGYDIHPLISMEEKKKLLEEAADHQYILFFGHDAHTECATVERTEKGIRLKEKFSLKDIILP